MEQSRILILGAGPSGISCAYHLAQKGKKVIIWDRNAQIGGLARTEIFRGFRFDVGPHRFFTKNDMVEQLWHEMAGNDVVEVQRLTRILYNGKLFRYPLQPFDALLGLGIGTATKAIFSYIMAQTFSFSKPAHFEDWVKREFGNVLYEIFFKHYTEKVWGIPCSKISGDWATQRIKGLSLWTAIRNACLPFLNKSGNVKSLVDSFSYPKQGAGQVYESMAEVVKKLNGTICMNREVIRLLSEGDRIVAVKAIENGITITQEVDHVFSSIPLTTLVQNFSPLIPDSIQNAVQSLYYRDHLSVNLIINRKEVFPDNWVYVHSPHLRCARISSYGNFSVDMLGDINMSAVTVEYFCFRHEKIWNTDDKELIKFAATELEMIGFAKSKEVIDGYVCREPDSYPVYHIGYREHVENIKKYIKKFKNLSCMGRGGMYKYNNQDHAMLSGVFAAQNYLGENYDVWGVNIDDEYLEEKQIDIRKEDGV